MNDEEKNNLPHFELTGSVLNSIIHIIISFTSLCLSLVAKTFAKIGAYTERDSTIGFGAPRKLSRISDRKLIPETLAKPKIRFLSHVRYTANS